MTTETNTAPVEDDNEAKATTDLEETTAETKKQIPLTVPVTGRPGGPGTGADGNYDPHGTNPNVN
ncbi:hypothetical protein [Amycolatopsis azurea]|uniref:Uncharacterized protein n=1 Tax=Amycolatopsis azurea DSM 43854 TaxID=1238180 RepID=M2P4R3_9PSEU|nr:hypothetical protein [Amycolatopsis azurea]EMD30199.1 hypothetical protein C791_0184 [Amycolatopsis azurea DSM 43854]OOC07128.1 hypothetical protein B0293_08670 [Amycolatopsis azurea DSM 43854]